MKHKLTSIIRVIPIIFLMLLCINPAWGQQKKGTGGTPTVQGMWWSEFNETLKSDASGCYWEVTFEWGCDQNNTTQFNLWMLPHGIRITVSGSNIVGIPTISGSSWSWNNSPVLISLTEAEWTFTPTDPNDPYSCPNTGTSVLPPSVIPYSTVITIKVYVSSTSGSHNITVSSLGWIGSGFIATTTDTPPIPVSAPTPPPAIPQNPSICKGKTTVVELIPNVSPPAKIKWYKHVPTNCTDDCLIPTMPLSADPNWVEVDNKPPQAGVNSIATNKLNQTTCYVAVIDSGCFSYLSTVARVEVCELLTGISISPIIGSDEYDTIDKKKRACIVWEGGLQLNYEQCCTTTVTWECKKNGITIPCGDIANLTLDAPTDPSQCYNKYTFTATVSNACGEKSASFTIYVDREITKDDITLTGNVWDLPPNLPSVLGPICYEQSARINTEKKCNQIEIVEWQEMKWTPTGDNSNGTWVTIQGALGTSLYHTNKLRNPGPGIQSVWYQVKIKNGACPEVWSDPYEIQVKPELTVSIITPISDRLCPPTTTSITLTAMLSYYQDVTYQWYRDGDKIDNSNSYTITVSLPGEYYVVVSDTKCGKTAKSDVITICSKPIVVIVGPCVVCDDTEFDLTALVFSEPEGCTSDCVTFQWTASNGGNIISSPNTQTITANSAGTYQVEVTCGDCTVESSIVVEECPPIASTCICGKWSPPPRVDYELSGVGPPIPGFATCDDTVWNIPLDTEINIINFTGDFICKGIDCIAEYFWEILDPNGIPVDGGNGKIPSGKKFIASKTGYYKLIITPICGSERCSPCVITFGVADNCECDEWSDPPKVAYTIGGPKPPGIKGSATCGDTRLILVGTKINISNFTGNFVCKGIACKAEYRWVITDPSGGLIDKGNDKKIDGHFTASMTGDYTLTITPICGSRCPPCVITFKVIKLRRWWILFEEGILTGEDDPVNIALNKERERMANTELGIAVEQWYAELNNKDWLSIMLKQYPDEVKSVLSVVRKLIQEDGKLDRTDLTIIEKTMRILDEEIARAPEGLIEKSLERLRSSIGLKWDQIMENYKK